MIATAYRNVSPRCNICEHLTNNFPLFSFIVQNLTKDDDVRKFVIRREVQPKNAEKKPYTKAPKIQRLVTPVVLQRKRHVLALKKRRAENAKEAEAEYKAMIAKRVKEAAEKRSEIKKRRASSLHKA